MICEATFGETPAWSSQVAAVAAIEELEPHDLPDGHCFYVEVIEALSEVAAPLPEAWFAGSAIDDGAVTRRATTRWSTEA
jgi:hypothetical protein